MLGLSWGSYILIHAALYIVLSLSAHSLVKERIWPPTVVVPLLMMFLPGLIVALHIPPFVSSQESVIIAATAPIIWIVPLETVIAFAFLLKRG